MKFFFLTSILGKYFIAKNKHKELIKFHNVRPIISGKKENIVKNTENVGLYLNKSKCLSK